MAVQATVVNHWTDAASAYVEFTAHSPADGTVLTFVVSTPALDARGSPLLPAQIQANLLTAAQAAFHAQFPTAAPVPNVPPNFNL